MNRAKRRAITRKQQREAHGNFHPRSLARNIVHRMMEMEEMSGVNKVIPGATQSAFARNWRNIADRIAR